MAVDPAGRFIPQVMRNTPNRGKKLQETWTRLHHSALPTAKQKKCEKVHLNIVTLGKYSVA